jgi:hypothetical protein
VKRLAAYGEPVEGTPFGRYRLIELLGRGSMGEVSHPHDTDTDRIAATKVVPTELGAEPGYRERFRRRSTGLNRGTMSDVSQGPEWWQAADLKWYPPELHADYVAPPPPVTPTLPPPPKLPPPPTLPPPPVTPTQPPVTPTQPPLTTKGDPSAQGKLVLVLAGLGLLSIAVQAVAFIMLHTTPALIAAVVVSWVLIIIGVTIVVRSDQSRARKWVFGIAFIFAVEAVGFLVGAALGSFIHKGSSPSSPSSHSASYQAGYTSGTSGSANAI